MNRPWQCKDTLKRLYVDERKTQREIADELGCSYGTVSRWLNNHEIDTRGAHPNPDHVGLQMKRSGHIRWQHQIDGKKHLVPVHRLLAVSEFGFEAVKGMDVHHINDVPWDNRPENIMLLTRSEHNAIRAKAD